MTRKSRATKSKAAKGKALQDLPLKVQSADQVVGGGGGLPLVKDLGDPVSSLQDMISNVMKQNSETQAALMSNLKG